MAFAARGSAAIAVYTRRVHRVYTAVVLTEIAVVSALWALGIYLR